jgi:hypothetical protein
MRSTEHHMTCPSPLTATATTRHYDLMSSLLFLWLIVVFVCALCVVACVHVVPGSFLERFLLWLTTCLSVHPVALHGNVIHLVPGSFLERFFAATSPLSPAERGAYLESPPEDAPDIEEAHQVCLRVEMRPTLCVWWGVTFVWVGGG